MGWVISGWILVLLILGYMAVGFITTLIISKGFYRSYLLDKSKSQINKMNYSFSRKCTEEELEEQENKRRAGLAKEAMTTGLVLGAIWPITLVLCIGLYLGFGLKNAVHKISIGPVDRERENELAYSKAKRIVLKYEEEQKQKFDKELGS